MSRYWQHNSPLHCPVDHMMYWLGSRYWICPKCNQIYVEHRTPVNRPGVHT